MGDLSEPAAIWIDRSSGNGDLQSVVSPAANRTLDKASGIKENGIPSPSEGGGGRCMKTLERRNAPQKRTRRPLEGINFPTMQLPTTYSRNRRRKSQRKWVRKGRTGSGRHAASSLAVLGGRFFLLGEAGDSMLREKKKSVNGEKILQIAPIEGRFS